MPPHGTDDAAILDPIALETIRTESRRAFPLEGCGFLLGPRGTLRISQARPQPNVHPGPRESRYRIDGLEYIRLDDELDATDVALLGIFHSHPRSPARPSETDRAAAWPGLLYFIQETREETLGELLAWRLDAAGRFHPVPYRVEPPSDATRPPTG